MTVHHHLDPSTLLRFASGELDEAFSVVVASHIAMCEDCRANLRDAETLGGAMLEDLEPAPMSDAALAFTLDRLGDFDTEPAPVPAAPAGDVPLPLRRLIGDSLADVKWKKIAPGVGKYMLPTSDGAKGKAFLLSINPGLAMPEHGHGGDELTLVIQGSYSDKFGKFCSGDIADLDEDAEHTPRVDSEIPCICLAATEEPTRFKTIIGKIFQPLLGI